MTPTTPAPRARTATDGTAIHDLGYQRYEGERVGARGALQALFQQGVRALFGMGRPFKSKAIPLFVVVVTMLPCLASVVAGGASGGALPIPYGVLIGQQLIMFVLFTAAQAPEILSRDQQHRVLPLMLTREITPGRYAFGRWLALFTSLVMIALAPALLLYLGEIGVAKVPSVAFEKMGYKIGPVLLLALLTAGVLSSVGTALAAFTARRAYATASIIGFFMIIAAVSVGLDEVGGVPIAIPMLLDPLRAIRTLALVLFGETTRSMELTPPPSVWVFIGVLLILSLIGPLLLHRRIQKVAK